MKSLRTASLGSNFTGSYKKKSVVEWNCAVVITITPGRHP